MKIKTIAILAFICLLNTTVFAQNDVFQIVDSLKSKTSNSPFYIGEIEVFPIETVSANCKKYEFVEVKDSIYEEKLQMINSFTADKKELTNELKTFVEDVQELVNAKAYLQEFIEDPEPSLMFKWQYLKKAQESLDKTSHKIDLYRSKEDVLRKSGGRSLFLMGNYVGKQQGEIHDILYKGSFLESKIENLKKKIDVDTKELMHIKKTKKVNMPTGMIIRSILKVDSTSIGKKIKGRFVKEEGYAIMAKDYQHFLANELILRDTLYSYVNELDARRMAVMCNQQNYIIKNIETGKRYYTTGDILKRWCLNSYLVDLYAAIDNLKIKRQMIDDKIILSYNGSQCVLTSDISDALIGNDPTCIKTMHSSVSKYIEYNKLASELALELSNYIKLYKSRLIQANEVEAWKKNTKECEILLNKMLSLPYADSRNYYEQLDVKQVGLHTMILDYVAYSKNKLGL